MRVYTTIRKLKRKKKYNTTIIYYLKKAWRSGLSCREVANQHDHSHTLEELKAQGKRH